MKFAPLPTLLLAIAATAVFPAHGDMVIVQKVDGIGQTAEMTAKIGAEKIRTDVTPQVSTIANAKTGEVTTLMHAQKMYMVISADAAKNLLAQQVKNASQQAGGGAASGPPKLQPTGKKEKINGYDADQYTFGVGNIKGTIWIAPDYPNSAAISAAQVRLQHAGLASMAKDLVPDVSAMPGVAVKSEVEINGQKIVTELESAKEETVDPSEYQVPADYHEIKMPAMPQQ